MIRPTSRKNHLTFGGDLVPDIDSWSLFHFSHNCRLGYSRKFISIIICFSRKLPKCLTPAREWIDYIFGAIRQTPRPGSRLLQKSGFKSRITFGWGFGKMVGDMLSPSSSCFCFVLELSNLWTSFTKAAWNCWLLRVWTGPVLGSVVVWSVAGSDWSQNFVWTGPTLYVVFLQCKHKM